MNHDATEPSFLLIIAITLIAVTAMNPISNATRIPVSLICSCLFLKRKIITRAASGIIAAKKGIKGKNAVLSLSEIRVPVTERFNVTPEVSIKVKNGPLRNNNERTDVNKKYTD